MFNLQWLMTLKTQCLLSLVGSGINSLAGLLLGSVLHFLSLVCGSIGSILSGALDGIACSTYG